VNIEGLVITIIGLSGVFMLLGAIMAVLERRQQRFDELEEFRRTIEAMRRMEQQDDYR